MTTLRIVTEGRTRLRRSCWDVAGASRLPLHQRDIPAMRTPSEPDLRPSGPLTQKPIGSPPVGPAPGQQPPLPHSSSCLGLDTEVDEVPPLWPDFASRPLASLCAQPVEHGWAGLPGNDKENGSDHMAVYAYGPPPHLSVAGVGQPPSPRPCH